MVNYFEIALSLSLSFLMLKIVFDYLIYGFRPIADRLKVPLLAEVSH